MIKIIAIENCDACGVCVDNCPTEVLDIVDGKVKIIDNEMCTDCRICIAVCPYGVLEVITEE